MVGRITSGASFGKLTAYLTGEEGRVDWASSRGGLPSDVNQAAALLNIEARRGVVEKPVVHVVVSFAEGDLDGSSDGQRGSQRQAEKMVGDVLERMGLGQHRAVLVAHNDKDHRHVHVMANRFDEREGKSWSRDYERLKLRKAIEEVERGLRPQAHGEECPGGRKGEARKDDAP